MEKLDAALTPGTAESLNRFIRNVQNGGVTPEMDKLAPIVPPAIQPAPILPPAIQPAIQPARQHLGQHLGQHLVQLLVPAPATATWLATSGEF